jgi:hypothetical protein
VHGLGASVRLSGSVRMTGSVRGIGGHGHGGHGKAKEKEMSVAAANNPLAKLRHLIRFGVRSLLGKRRPRVAVTASTPRNNVNGSGANAAQGQVLVQELVHSQAQQQQQQHVRENMIDASPEKDDFSALREEKHDSCAGGGGSAKLELPGVGDPLAVVSHHGNDEEDNDNHDRDNEHDNHRDSDDYKEHNALR